MAKMCQHQHISYLSIRLGIPGAESDLNGDLTYSPETSSTDYVINSWKQGQILLNKSWQQWMYEYIPTLRERSQTALQHGRLETAGKPKLNSVVLIKDEKKTRGTWMIGRVVQLHTSADGETCSATVITPGQRQLQRSMCHLYPITEYAPTNDTSIPVDETTDNVSDYSNEAAGRAKERPMRKAATLARANLQRLVKVAGN